MAAPGDAGTVLKAVRLGWTVAEVRGRYWPDGQPGSSLPLPKRAGEPLPLQMERDADEVRQTALVVLAALAEELKVDDDTDTPSSPRFSDEVKAAARDLAGTVKGSPEEGAAWKKLADLIYAFDSHTQDALAMQSDTVACGYQLGRSLAECYWALDPKQPNTPETWTSWSFLLGTVRCREIGRYLGRLTDYFHPYTTAAIAGSLEIWKSVATNQDWQKLIEGDEKWRANADIALYRQIRNWYELLLLKQDPSTLIKPYQLLRNPRLVLKTVRLFWAQLLLAVLAAAAVAVFAWLLSRPSVNAGLTTLLGTLGITGFSIAGLAAKLKNDSQAMITRIKQDAYTDLIAVAITTAPPEPTAGEQAPDTSEAPPRVSHKREKEMILIAQNRSLTPVTPN
jgi:hypothetical protein